MSYFCIIEPESPFVAIYKGWQDLPETQMTAVDTPLDGKYRIDSPPPTSSSGQGRKVSQKDYQFVNSNTPGRPKDDKVRKLIRSHARNLCLGGRGMSAYPKKCVSPSHPDSRKKLLRRRPPDA